ncbi:MAG: hypothetical protein PHF74_03905 [Dehalococcoidales bacterium]|nr:hypothetical protein [Dehalococcoidales bacterium]
MYQVTVQNPEKKVKKGDYLTFTIANFPPNTNLDYNIGEHNQYNSIGLGSVTSDANGAGTFATQLNNKAGKYRLTVRNYTYGSANDDFVIED